MMRWRFEACEVDNRNSEQMLGYLEDRIEAMKRRIRELEAENEELRLFNVETGPGCGPRAAGLRRRARI